MLSVYIDETTENSDSRYFSFFGQLKLITLVGLVPRHDAFTEFDAMVDVLH